MTFEHDFGYSLTPFFPPLIKERRRKLEWIAKIAIKTHAFLFDHFPHKNISSIYKIFLHFKNPIIRSVVNNFFDVTFKILSHFQGGSYPCYEPYLLPNIFSLYLYCKYALLFFYRQKILKKFQVLDIYLVHFDRQDVLKTVHVKEIEG